MDFSRSFNERRTRWRRKGQVRSWHVNDLITCLNYKVLRQEDRDYELPGPRARVSSKLTSSDSDEINFFFRLAIIIGRKKCPSLHP